MPHALDVSGIYLALFSAAAILRTIQRGEKRTAKASIRLRKPVTARTRP